MRLSDSPEKYEKTRAAVAGLCEGEDAGEALTRHPVLTDLLQTRHYRKLLADISAVSDDLVPVVQALLERREYEERLRHIRETSPDDYVEELRVIQADELRAALVNGCVVNAHAFGYLPLEIPHDESVSGAFLHDPVPTALVDAHVLRDVLLEAARAPEAVDPRGLRLSQVVVRGTLDLNWLDVPFPLGFNGCHFRGWLWLDNFRAPELTFDTCDFTASDNVGPYRGALNATRMSIERELRFFDCKGFDQLFLTESTLGYFHLRDPHNEAEPSASFRTILDDSKIGTLTFPSSPAEQKAGETYILPDDIRIERVSGPLESITAWLRSSRPDTGDEDTPTGASARVWDEVADALDRSGRADDATQLRIDYRRHRNSARNPVARFLTWLALDATVRYLHRPSRALRWFAGLFFVAWALAFAFHGHLVKSPLVSDPVPASWLSEMLSAGAWSFMYALDIMIVPLSLGQVDSMWPGSVWLAVVFAVLKGAGIILLGLFLGSVTTLISKRSGA